MNSTVTAVPAASDLSYIFWTIARIKGKLYTVYTIAFEQDIGHIMKSIHFGSHLNHFSAIFNRAILYKVEIGLDF